MSKKGFTLMELVVSVGVMAVLLGVLSVMLKQGTDIYKAVEASISVRQDARNAMERIVRETRESNGSTIVATDNILFTTPRIVDGGGNPIAVRYWKVGDQILRGINATSTIIATNVSSLAFVKAGPVLQVTIETFKIVEGRTLTCTLTQKVRLRNE